MNITEINRYQVVPHGEVPAYLIVTSPAGLEMLVQLAKDAKEYHKLKEEINEGESYSQFTKEKPNGA